MMYNNRFKSGKFQEYFLSDLRPEIQANKIDHVWLKTLLRKTMKILAFLKQFSLINYKNICFDLVVTIGDPQKVIIMCIWSGTRKSASDRTRDVASTNIFPLGPYVVPRWFKCSGNVSSKKKSFQKRSKCHWFW